MQLGHALGRRFLCVLLFLALAIFPGFLLGQELPTAGPTPSPEAPFGLTWLASPQAVLATGASLGKAFATEFGDSYTAMNLPKEFDDLHYAALSFGYTDQLIRITAVSTPFDNDEDGIRLKARYEELRHLLEQKYGAGKSEVNIDKNLDGDRFVQGLYLHKNWMYTVFAPPDMRVELSLFWDSGTSHWRIIFEHLPGMKTLQGGRKKKDEEAL